MSLMFERAVVSCASGVGEVVGAAQDHFWGAIRLVSLEHAVSPPRERPHNRASTPVATVSRTCARLHRTSYIDRQQ